MAFTTLQIVQLGLLGAALLGFFLAGLQQRRYLALAPRIESAAELEGFRKFARTQMYWTLGMLILVAPAIGLIFLDSELKPSAAKRVVLWLPYGVFGLGSLLVKRHEKRIQDPDRCAAAFRPEFERICLSWKKRILPDF